MARLEPIEEECIDLREKVAQFNDVVQENQRLKIENETLQGKGKNTPGLQVKRSGLQVNPQIEVIDLTKNS